MADWLRGKSGAIYGFETVAQPLKIKMFIVKRAATNPISNLLIFAASSLLWFLAIKTNKLLQ